MADKHICTCLVINVHVQIKDTIVIVIYQTRINCINYENKNSIIDVFY